jgi:hypothetical protein
VSGAVEFRVGIDAPEDESIVPSFIEATGEHVYMRFHGKNCENWFKRNITAGRAVPVSVFERELQSLAPGLRSLEECGVTKSALGLLWLAKLMRMFVSRMK